MDVNVHAALNMSGKWHEGPVYLKHKIWVLPFFQLFTAPFLSHASVFITSCQWQNKT